MDYPRELLSQINRISVIIMIFYLFSSCRFLTEKGENSLPITNSPGIEIISHLAQVMDSVELDYKNKVTGQTDYVITLKGDILKFKGLNRGDVIFTCKIDSSKINRKCKDVSNDMTTAMTSKWDVFIYHNREILSDSVFKIVIEDLMNIMLINSPVLPDISSNREFPMVGNRSYSYCLNQSWNTIEILIGSGKPNQFWSSRGIIVNQDSIISRDGDLRVSKPLLNNQKNRLNKYISNINLDSQLSYYLINAGLEGFQIKVDDKLIYSVSPEGCSIFIGNGNYNKLYYYLMSLCPEISKRVKEIEYD